MRNVTWRRLGSILRPLEVVLIAVVGNIVVTTVVVVAVRKPSKKTCKLKHHEDQTIDQLYTNVWKCIYSNTVGFFS